MVRTILKSVFAIWGIYLAWSIGPVYLAYREFKVEAADVTRVGGRGRERVLVAEVAELADRVGVPVAREAIKVRKEGNHTYLEVTYTEDLRFAPLVSYPWTFSINVDGLAVKPRTVGDVFDGEP